MGINNEQKQIYQSLKIHGLTIDLNALKKLEEFIKNERLELQDIIYAIKKNINKKKIRNGIITTEALMSALDTLLIVSNNSEYQQIQVFGSFDIPRINYISNLNTFHLIKEESSLFNDINNDKNRLRFFLNRFSNVKQRVLRNPIFRQSLLEQKNYIQLSTIESLLGSKGKKTILGLLGQNDNKTYYIEDENGKINIDITNTKLTKGFFCVNCVVLAEGEVLDEIFHVESMGFPPPETKVESMKAIKNIDPLGLEISAQQLKEIVEMENLDTNSIFIVLSDVHLDNKKVMKSIKRLFKRLEDNHMTPPLFIFMGNFISQPIGQGNASLSMVEYKKLFDNLGQLIASFKDINNKSLFVFIPGPNDPGGPPILPRHGLSQVCTQGLVNKVKNIVLGTNPCRIRNYTQDIVIIRQDLQRKMFVHSIQLDNKCTNNETNEDISEQLVKTIVDQAYLSPLPFSVSPIYRGNDASLHLFPVPDVLILGETSEQFQWGYNNMAVFNPGPFYMDFSFVVYRPITNKTEFSTVKKNINTNTNEYTDDSDDDDIMNEFQD